MEALVPQFDELRVADRCDRCGAQAFVRVVVAEVLDLLFCGHHFRRHEDALVDQGGWVLHDHRDRINSKPTDPTQSQGF